MSLNRIISLGILVLCLVSPLQAGETESLKGAFEDVIDKLAEKDLQGFLKLWHPAAVLYTRDDPFPVDAAVAGPDMWRDIFDEFFEMSEEAQLSPVDIEYRVTGDTGLVWGRVQLWIALKDGQKRTQDSRLSVVFVREGNLWKIINWHASAIPDRIGASR